MDKDEAIIDWLLTRVAETPAAAIPEQTLARTRTFLLDTLGVGVAGCHGTGLAQIIEMTRSWGQGDEATVWVSGQKVPAPTAAFLNGYQIHSLEFDCLVDEAVLHPMATLLAAVMAHAERRSAAGRPVSGGELAAAVVLGIDVAIFLGLASRQALRFFRPATAGGMGAAAAIARLEGFDKAQLRQALGHQYGQLCGTMQAHVEGSPQLGLQIGYNARAALISVDLVKAGLRAPDHAFLGPHGYFRLIEAQYDLEAAQAALQAGFQMDRMAHKPYPSGRLTHGAVGGLTGLMAREGFDAGDIEAITLRMPPLVYKLMGRPDVPEPEANYAKLCLPFVAALALREGTVEIQHFLDRATLSSPGLHALAARIGMEEDGNPDPNAMYPQHIEVTLRGGMRHELRIDAAYGHPEAPLTEAANLEKFRACWRHAARLPEDNAARVIAAVDDLGALEDVARLVPLLVARGPARREEAAG